MSARAAPTGEEIILDPEDVLVTKTDLTGHITYANEVFCRVAGFTEAESLGAPHSLIRHPKMPRCVFKLLWDTIQAGDEIFAYVLNLAKTGKHYWVFAHVSPTFDERGTMIGYHSSRRCPDRSAVAKAEALYATLLAEENRYSDKLEAAAASTKLLLRLLAENHVTYEQFVFSL